MQAASLAAADRSALACGAGGGSCTTPRGLNSVGSTMVHKHLGVDLKIFPGPPGPLVFPFSANGSIPIALSFLFPCGLPVSPQRECSQAWPTGSSSADEWPLPGRSRFLLLGPGPNHCPNIRPPTSTTPLRPTGSHLHIRRIRAPISTGWTFDDLAIAIVVAFGQTQTSNRSTIESGINRVRAVYIWRSPLLFC